LKTAEPVLARVARTTIGDELPNSGARHAADVGLVGAEIGDFKVLKQVAALVLEIRTALAIAGGSGLGSSEACKASGGDGVGGFGVQGERGECRGVGFREVS